ncbi:MAG TPA: hypothetical protein ENJ61_00215 [Aquifex aeolicus]|uniref:Uncharacterized protein n=1 Tax=Aquifex aeolicus TaxID=63363 RepID=A0A7C5L248_AQUAO|nr:hypothetical protein [Aquifex aeolicus]
MKEYYVQILCPPLSPNHDLNDFKACSLDRRPTFLKIKGGRLSEEGFLKEVRVDDHGSLYRGTWSLVKATLDLMRKGKVRVIPLAGTGTETEKPITEKQRRLLLSLMKELGEKYSIPATRKDASVLIDYLKSRKRAVKKKAVA